MRSNFFSSGSGYPNPTHTNSYDVALFTHLNERTAFQFTLRVTEYGRALVRRSEP